MTIYQEAVNKFGERAQMIKACEECGELGYNVAPAR
jgi:hypothetical protein